MWCDRVALFTLQWLQPIVDIHAVLSCPKWKVYTRTIFAVAYKTLWDTAEKKVTEDGCQVIVRVRTRKVYEALREAPERYFPERLGVGDVPCKYCLSLWICG
jgi:hypothetical protein